MRIEDGPGRCNGESRAYASTLAEAPVRTTKEAPQPHRPGMQPESPAPSNNDAPAGLPPVKPPSARFIVQLFLIPGLIVAGLVFVFVFGGLSWVGTSTPESFRD